MPKGLGRLLKAFSSRSW